MCIVRVGISPSFLLAYAGRRRSAMQRKVISCRMEATGIWTYGTIFARDSDFLCAFRLEIR
jgi:hypothetical protein